MKKGLFIITLILISLGSGYLLLKNTDINPKHNVGDVLDSFNNVSVYYNGAVSNIEERNTTEDGYNLGLKYQCVEFVKRYYWEHLDHKMPNSFGHAKDFYNPQVKDGQINKDRNLRQFINLSKSKPQIYDLVIYDGTSFNKFGHVSIISAVSSNTVERFPYPITFSEISKLMIECVNAPTEM